MPSSSSPHNTRKRTVEFPGDEAGNVEAMHQALMQGLVHQMNVGQMFITVPEDRLWRHLTNHRSKLLTRYIWTTPLGLSLSALATLVAADFRNALGLGANDWRVLFTGVFGIAFVWLIGSLVHMWRTWHQGTIEYLIERIAKHEH